MSGLPGDLDRLGDELQAAAGRSIRRRTRRQAAFNALGALLLVVPLAVAVSNAPVEPGGAYRTLIDSSEKVGGSSPPTGALVRHIPDEVIPPPARSACLDAHDCRVPLHPSLEPAPAGRI